MSTRAPAHIKLLCIEDNPDDFELLGLALERADPMRHYELTRVDDEAGFREALDPTVDVVLCDFKLPRFSPFAALDILAARGSPVPLVVVTRAIGEEAAVHVMRCGARDYVTKDKMGTLPQVIDRVMDERARAQEQRRLSRELEAAYRRLKQLSARIVVAQEHERTLISRELHDVLGQTLTGMMIHLHAARRTEDPAVARGFTDTALQMAQEAVNQIKTMSFMLRPPQLDLLGLVPAVTTSVQRMGEPAGLDCQIRVRGTEPSPLGDTASVIVRLVQEAVTNVVRHARASRIIVRLRFLPRERIGLLVVDDGAGFDAASILSEPASERNVGLRGMIERTELVGGRLCIRSRPGRGCAVRAML